MHLAAVEEGEAVEGAAAVVVEEAQYREGDEHLVGVQAGVAAVQHVDLGVLDGLYHLLRYEFDAVVDADQVLEGVEQQGGAGAEELAGGGGDDGAVGQLDGCRGYTLAVAALLGGDWFRSPPYLLFICHWVRVLAAFAPTAVGAVFAAAAVHHAFLAAVGTNLVSGGTVLDIAA